MKSSLTVLILVCGLFALAWTNVDAQKATKDDAKPAEKKAEKKDDDKAKAKPAVKKVARPEVGTVFKEWPTKQLGFSHAEWRETLFSLYRRADFSALADLKSRAPVKLTASHLAAVGHDDARLRSAAMRAAGLTPAKVGDHQLEYNSLRLWSERPRSNGDNFTLVSIKFGALRPKAESKGARWKYREVPQAKASAMWAVVLRESGDGKETRERHLIMDSGDRRTPFAAHGRIIGPETHWKVLLALDPKTEPEKLSVGALAAMQIHEPTKWWESDVTIWSQSFENYDMSLAPWAYSSFVDDKTVAADRRTYMYCFLYDVGVPKDDLVKIDDCFLPKKVAAARRKKASADDYFGYLKPSTMVGPKLRSLKTIFATAYRKALKAKKAAEKAAKKRR